MGSKKKQKTKPNLAQNILDELEVMDLVISKIEGMVQEVRTVITSDGDPEQNIQDNAMLIVRRISDELDFYLREIWGSTTPITEALKDKLLNNLDIETIKDQRHGAYWFFRKQIPTSNPDKNVEEQAG